MNGFHQRAELLVLHLSSAMIIILVKLRHETWRMLTMPSVVMVMVRVTR